MQWTQYAVDTVHSGIAIYGGGDIVFGAKRSNQWIQWMQSHSGHSTQRNQWTQYAVDAVCSGIVVYGDGDIVFDTKRSKQWMQQTQYAVFSGCSGHSSSTQLMQWNSGIWWWGHCF